MAAVVPTMLIGLILSFLLSAIMDEIKANKLARNELSMMAGLHNAAIDLQKIRGLEQIATGNNAKQTEIAEIEKLYQAILDVQKIRGLEQIKIITPHLAERVTGLRHEFVVLIDELIAAFGKQDKNARQILEKVSQEARTLFSNRIAENSSRYRFEQYTHIISSLHSVMLTESLNLYHLMHHEGLNSAYLIELHGLDIPYLIESIGRVRGYGSGLLGRNDVTPEEKQRWTELIGGAREALELVEKKIKIIQEVTGGTDLFEDEHIMHARQQVREYVRYALAYINTPSELVSALEYFDNGTLAIERCLLIYDVLQRNISNLLVRRQQELNNQFVNLTIGSALVVILLLYFTATFYRNSRRAFYKIKEVNDELSESSARLREIVDLLPVMIAVRNSSGQIILENRAFKDAAYCSHDDIFPNERRAREIGVLFIDDEQVLAAKTLLVDKEIEFTDNHENKRVLRLNKIPYDSDGSEKGGVLTIALDITDTRRVHELQRVAGVGHWEWHLETGRLYLSDEFCSIIGWGKGEFNGNIDALLQAVTEECRQSLSEAFEQAGNSGEGFEIEVGIKRNNMSARHIRMQSHRYQRVSDGSQIMVGAVKDITFEKEAARALQASEKKFRLLVESLRNEYFFYSRDASGRLIYISPSVQNVLGYQPDVFLKQECFPYKTLMAESHDHNMEHLDGVQSNHYEAVIADVDGVERYLDLSEATILDGSGETIVVEGIAHDITNRKNSENELRRSEKKLRELSLHLQEAREGERISIAHDIHDEIGGMLAALKMDANLLLAKLRHATVEEAVFTRLNRMTQHMDMLMQSVRRIISNLRPSVLDNLGLLQAIEWQLSELRSHFGIECHFDRRLKEEQLDFADMERCVTHIFRITQELITNIIRHSHASRVTVLVAIIENDFVLSVSDNGCGMDESLLLRADSFGLIGIRERVRSMNGECSIISRNAAGTIVVVRIPVMSKKN